MRNLTSSTALSRPVKQSSLKSESGHGSRRRRLEVEVAIPVCSFWTIAYMLISWAIAWRTARRGRSPRWICGAKQTCERQASVCATALEVSGFKSASVIVAGQQSRATRRANSRDGGRLPHDAFPPMPQSFIGCRFV